MSEFFFQNDFINQKWDILKLLNHPNLKKNSA